MSVAPDSPDICRRTGVRQTRRNRQGDLELDVSAARAWVRSIGGAPSRCVGVDRVVVDRRRLGAGWFVALVGEAAGAACLLGEEVFDLAVDAAQIVPRGVAPRRGGDRGGEGSAWGWPSGSDQV